MIDITEERDLLTKYNQQHLLNYWNEISEEEKIALQNDIRSINVPAACEYYKIASDHAANTLTQSKDSIKPVPAELYGSVQTTPDEVLQSYRELGLTEIAEGNVGVILLAGGQGTRIGVPYPKGMFKIGLPSDKSLFQVQAERILKLETLAFEKTGKKHNITWFIMTSEHTMNPTKNFFDKHDYFGIEKQNVIFFEQGLLPCFNFDGKIILESKYQIAKAPGGNGGIYMALKKNGILSEFSKRSIKYVHVYSVDNILVKVADPVFIGYCIKSGSDCGVKVIEKKLPNEGLGVVCIVDDKYKVVEYSEIDTESAHLRDNSGKLTYRAGNICNHFFSTDFLNRIADQFESKLKLHIAKKKIPYLDTTGTKVKPDQPNGIKIEKFIFDVFEFCDNLVVWEVERDQEFSALKNSNSEKTDNPTTSCLALYNLHKTYIENAGGKVNPDNSGNIVCEISPSLSYDGEGLTSLVDGKTFESPILLE